ncbi:MAG TPA: 50S ribosomal protein L22 [Ktedonobacterales bacterium]
MLTRAIAKNVGHPPRKVRRVTDAIKGRRVSEALAILKFLPNMPARDVYKVVASAAANAENNYSMDPDELWVTNALADEGMTIRRFRARPHGRASRILRRSTHITIFVSDDPNEVPRKARASARRR